MSKRNLVIFTSILILILSAFTIYVFFIGGPKTSPLVAGQTFEVVLGENGFEPAEISIKSGDSVKFVTRLNEPFWPASDLHPTHGIYPEFDPQQPILSDQSWTFQFLKTGKWKYHDHLKPIFKGLITVK